LGGCVCLSIPIFLLDIYIRFEAFTVTKCNEDFSNHQLCQYGVNFQPYEDHLRNSALHLDHPSHQSLMMEAHILQNIGNSLHSDICECPRRLHYLADMNKILYSDLYRLCINLYFTWNSNFIHFLRNN